jgi:hypothetical protein
MASSSNKRGEQNMAAAHGREEFIKVTPIKSGAEIWQNCLDFCDEDQIWEKEIRNEHGAIEGNKELQLSKWNQSLY